MIRSLSGDCRALLPTLAAESVHCVVTSPPYFGLRDYGTASWSGGDPACDHQQNVSLRRDSPGGFQNSTSRGTQASTIAVARQYAGTCGKCGAVRTDSQIGLEATPDAYIAEMVAVFREVRRVLRAEGTVWLNLGDSYVGGNQGGAWKPEHKQVDGGGLSSWQGRKQRTNNVTTGLASKQLMMMPARVALALQADGWWLRSDIIWHKPNPMPESTTDRPTSAHEHVFLLAKSARYFFDNDAIREPHTEGTHSRGGTKTNGHDALIRSGNWNTLPPTENPAGRSCRNVWTIATAPFSGSHFATFPPALVERCIKAGTRPGDTVLDPFGGAGTVGLVADRLNRNAVLIELNPAYQAMATARITDDCPLFAEVAD